MKRDFINSREWRIIAAELEKQISLKSIAALRESKSFEEMRYSSGYVDALRDVLNLPNTFLHDEDEEKLSGEDGGESLVLANNPRIARKLTSFK